MNKRDVVLLVRQESFVLEFLFLGACPELAEGIKQKEKEDD
ncbi:MAG: hypothetical protein WBM13_06565 [Bacteroidia bacterium]